MKNLYFLLVLFVAACSFGRLEAGLPLLKGRNIETAIQYLGIPDAQMEIAGRDVFVWNNAYSVNSVTPVTSYSNATAYGYGGMATAYGTSTAYVPETHNYSCTIKAIADKEGIINSLQYEGNEGGCSTFVSSMDRIISDLGPQDVAAEE